VLARSAIETSARENEDRRLEEASSFRKIREFRSSDDLKKMQLFPFFINAGSENAVRCRYLSRGAAAFGTSTIFDTENGTKAESKLLSPPFGICFPRGLLFLEFIK